LLRDGQKVANKQQTDTQLDPVQPQISITGHATRAIQAKLGKTLPRDCNWYKDKKSWETKFTATWAI